VEYREIIPRKYGMAEEISSECKDTSLEILKLTIEFLKQLNKKGRVPITKLETWDSPYQVKQWCTKKDCPFKQRANYDIEMCIKDHPDFVKSEIVHQIGVTCWTLKREELKYKDHLVENGNLKYHVLRVPI